jgi:hypothetical protein
LGLLSTPESCRARTNMAVGPRLTDAAAAAAAELASAAAGQTPPAVARALGGGPSPTPGVGTALANRSTTASTESCGNYLSAAEAVEHLKAQLGLVEALGWKDRLLKESPALDLTLGQTKTETSGVKELKAALLTTLRAVATLAQALKLEVARKPTKKQLCRELLIPGAEVVARRTTFVEENAAAVAAADAKAAEIAADAKASKAAADAQATEVAAAAKASKNAAKATKDAAKAAAKAAAKDAVKAAKAQQPAKPKKRRALEPPAPDPPDAARKRAPALNATRASVRIRLQ